ncbi:diguanylate cyclase [Rhodanobacter aciditrophus]|uniref:diguanylate cyclase n=1 Tax=Rhodanobacter aciditrophus TaxID=1623218 RepID=A0ABW4B0A9_9GAMM
MKRISLWGLIVVPFALLAILGGATVYILSTVTLANVSDNVGWHYMREIESRVYDRVTEFMAPLDTVVQVNRDAISYHPEYLDDLDVLAGRFYEQAVAYPYMTFVSFATADGRYVNSTRDPFGSSHHVATNYTRGPNFLDAFNYDPVDFVGTHIESEPTFKGYDPRTRPFYQDALQQDGMTWSAIEPYFGYESLGVGLSAPIYAQDGTLLGVTATSVALVSLDKFLQSIELVDDSYVFLAEANGDLIATSRDQALFSEEAGAMKRVSLSTYQDPLFQLAGTQLAEGTRQIEMDGKGYLYHVRPVPLPYGQTWYVGVLIPESYYKNILSDYSEALMWIVLLMFLSIALAGSFVARFIARPILQLNQAATSHSLEQIRNLPRPFSRVREINSLGRRLQNMAYRLSDAMQNLEQKVAQRTSDLKDENETLMEQSTTDELTGLYNRRGFKLLSEQALKQAQDQDLSLTMVLCDIDHFKMVNDSLGHSVGDQALAVVASVLKEHFRSEDICVRYGGEEFMLIIVGMTRGDVMKRLNLVRQALCDHPDLPERRITLSFGVTHLDPPVDTPLEILIQEVDTKLYRAKHEGRDKIVG